MTKEEKLEKTIDKMLGFKEYSATFWVAGFAGKEKINKIKMKAKSYDEAFAIGMKEWEQYRKDNLGEDHLCRGEMDKSKREYGEKYE